MFDHLYWLRQDVLTCKLFDKVERRQLRWSVQELIQSNRFNFISNMLLTAIRGGAPVPMSAVVPSRQ